jgi:hypothetical protein
VPAFAPSTPCCRSWSGATVGDEDLGQGPEFDLDGPVARMFVAIERLDTAEEFARAVNEILAR